MSSRKAHKKKGNAPAFQFYVGDFLTGTITMSLAEVGGYIRLLGHQWSSGSVPGDDLAALARAMTCDRAEADAVWPKIRDKFRCKKDGVWINSRLEKERKKQAAFRKLQSAKGKLGGRGKAAVKPEPKPSDNRNKALQSSPLGSNTTPVVPLERGRRRRRKVQHISDAKHAQLDRQQQAIDEHIAAKSRTA